MADLAALTPAQAARLNGREAWFRVRVCTATEAVEGRWLLCECDVDEGIEYTLWLPRGEEVEARMVVRARLRVIRHAGLGLVPDFTGHRVEVSGW